MPQLTRHFAQEPTWRWLTDVWDHADADWLGQEIFDIMKQASMRGDIENLVHCQASILATICPTGTPTRQYWLWSWRLAHNAAIDHRLRTQVRPLRGPVTAYS